MVVFHIFKYNSDFKGKMLLFVFYHLELDWWTYLKVCTISKLKFFLSDTFPACVELNLADNNQFIKYLLLFLTYNLLLEEIIMKVVINTLEL